MASAGSPPIDSDEERFQKAVLVLVVLSGIASLLPHISQRQLPERGLSVVAHERIGLDHGEVVPGLASSTSATIASFLASLQVVVGVRWYPPARGSGRGTSRLTRQQFVVYDPPRGRSSRRRQSLLLWARTADRVETCLRGIVPR